MDQAAAERSPHIAYCGGSFGRVSLMTADTELAEHARDCVQLLVNVHSAGLAVRVDGVTSALRPFDAMVIGPRQTYAIPRQGVTEPVPGAIGFLLVKTDAPGDAAATWRPGTSASQTPMRALSHTARDDAAQLVSDLLCDAPEARAVERGVIALQAAMAPALEELTCGRRETQLQAHIAREADALRFDDLQEFGSIGQRASAYGISERHFLTLFRRATRLPPKAFYNMRRLEAAFALLADASRTVADIGYHLGFSAPPHFTRFMRSNTGWTPSAYRAHLQQLPPPLRPLWAHAPAARRRA